MCAFECVQWPPVTLSAFEEGLCCEWRVRGRGFRRRSVLEYPSNSCTSATPRPFRMNLSGRRMLRPNDFGERGPFRPLEWKRRLRGRCHMTNTGPDTTAIIANAYSPLRLIWSHRRSPLFDFWSSADQRTHPLQILKLRSCPELNDNVLYRSSAANVTGIVADDGATRHVDPRPSRFPRGKSDLGAISPSWRQKNCH